MEDYVRDIENRLDELMSADDAPRDVISLGRELSMEYPAEFKRFTSNMAKKYELSVCGAHHVHINGLLTILDRWAEDGRVEKILDRGTILWRKR